MTNAVAKAENTQVISTDIFKTLVDNSMTGRSGMTAEDFSIPRIGIVQSLSPQRQQVKPEYIEGVVEGDIFENVTKRFWHNQPLHVVPVKYIKNYVEWKPRNAGGGLVKNHGADRTAYDACAVNDKGQHVTKDGNVIQPTGEYYVIIINENGSLQKAILSMSGAFIKNSRAWNTLIDAEVIVDGAGKVHRAPIFYRTWKLTTGITQNKKGDSWFAWNISEKAKDKTIIELANGSDTLLNECLSFVKGIESGELKATEDIAEPITETGSDASIDDDSIPM